MSTAASYLHRPSQPDSRRSSPGHRTTHDSYAHLSHSLLQSHQNQLSDPQTNHTVHSSLSGWTSAAASSSNSSRSSYSSHRGITSAHSYSSHRSYAPRYTQLSQQHYPADSPPSVADNHLISMPVTTRRRPPRKPDWAEFYKNGLPKEVIVIDDTPEPIHPREKRRKLEQHQHQHQQHLPRDSFYNSSVTTLPSHPSSYTTGHRSGSTERLASTVSNYHNYNSHSLSKPTTAHRRSVSYSDSEYKSYGSKRKRTRHSEFDSSTEKYRELKVQDPQILYRPPPQPPIKAKDVYVPVIPDHNHNRKNVDDEDGHYIVTPDTFLTDRYLIVRLLGQGTFGKVVEAVDRKRGTACAIKIVRSVQKYRDASRIELRVLSTLACNDRTNQNRCIHLRDCFDYRNHICIVTDLYGQSVFDFLKSNEFVPFPNSHIQSFARQLFNSVAFLHDLNLIHTDLKPENILLVHNSYQRFTYNRTVPSSTTTINRTAEHRKVLLDPEIRLIDFGSATFNDEFHSSIVSTRHYRAPEIILNLGWSFPCDIWSIGCILVEFYTGDALFQTHNNLEHLAMMEPICGGKIESDIVRTVLKSEKGASSKNPAAEYFRNGKLNYPNAETSRTSRKYVKAMKRLHEFIPPTSNFNIQFLSLLRSIFVYNPNKRVTAKQALRHPWFSESVVDDGVEAMRIKKRKQSAATNVSSTVTAAPGVAGGTICFPNGSGGRRP